MCSHQDHRLQLADQGWRPAWLLTTALGKMPSSGQRAHGVGKERNLKSAIVDGLPPPRPHPFPPQSFRPRLRSCSGWSRPCSCPQTPWPTSSLVHLLARSYGVQVHLDGARLMNAAVALCMPPARIVERCDSVSLCFSKVGKPLGRPRHRRVEMPTARGRVGSPSSYVDSRSRWAPLTPSPMRPQCRPSLSLLPPPEDRDAHPWAGRQDSPLFPQGLGATVGALVGGPKGFTEEAWRLRKALGGGMRQAGVLAVAALVGLTDAEEVLLKDHQNAQRFARGAWTPPTSLWPQGCALGVPCSWAQTPSRCASFQL
ncbi:uncharacterized protein LOC101288592 [Orcinus orca]|uniref:uncharacterized protein LOC101288592 n=1 Tax=Orcinus orca TaxID=9733 RepID=UPI0014414187|nr:uncharacterized protein LOC101288592 [Orcinus orca]